MSLRQRLRTIVLLAVLEFGSVSGVPMPPEKIRGLMDAIHRQKLAHVLPTRESNGDPQRSPASSRLTSP